MKLCQHIGVKLCARGTWLPSPPLQVRALGAGCSLTMLVPRVGLVGIARRTPHFVTRTSYRTSSHAAAVSRGVRGYEQTLERNWGGNVRFGAAQVHEPRTLAELQASVRDAAAPCRVVGRGHSFSPVAECAGGTLLSLHHMNQILDFEAPAAGRLGCITVQGGTTYTEIARFLDGRGALRNLPSCPQFTVAGAIATGTHGSGVHIQGLACDVRMIEFVRGCGGNSSSYLALSTPNSV